jgi:excinuclease UvrABC nuclease subunit
MKLNDVVNMAAIKKLKFQDHNIEKNHSEIGGGIYRFYDKVGKVIYVGKSNNLHRRLHQHFGKDTNTKYFIDEVDHYEVFVENDPILQTLLEGIFIAHHKPKYNDEVKDKERMNEKP